AGRVDDAIDAYAKAILSNPGSAAAHNDLGVMYEAKGWVANAETEYLRALQLNPREGPAHMNLALLYEQQGRISEAAPHWQRRAELGPGDEPVDQAFPRLVGLAPAQLQGQQVLAPVGEDGDDPDSHAAAPPSWYSFPWRVPPVAALAGGRFVVDHLTGRMRHFPFSTKPGTLPHSSEESV
ncbi:MAG: tetratricopeptide repeat protein, partial [Candidatus Rokubacteria bacterium]|nr:tetratricopeptide repeat protein [Candidatus Rokubacteria bacterium]